MRGMRDWVVGGALILSDEGVLLVQNRRRNGSHDWTPPGGVIDEGETLLDGLTREVEEETGLRVTEWAGPVYEVRCEAPDLGWRLRVEAHVAVAYEGELHVDDPDGIVVDARFVDVDTCGDDGRRAGSPGCASRSASGSPSDGPTTTSRPVRLPRGRRAPGRGGRHPSGAVTGRPPARSSTSTWTRSTRRSSSSRNPALRGKPVIVGGPGRPRRRGGGELRGAGVRHPLGHAVDPGPTALPARGVRGRRPRPLRRGQPAPSWPIFTSFTPLVEAISLDEAFLDVTGRPPPPRRRPDDRRQDPGRGPRAGGPHLLGRRRVVQVRRQAGLRGGQAAGRPHGARSPGSGSRSSSADEVLAFLHPLPVQALWGVGPEDAREAPPPRRRHRRRPGRASTSGPPSPPWARPTAPTCAGCRMGIDDREVVPQQRAKSIGHEETFARDHHSLDTLQHELVRLGDSVAGRLRAARAGGPHDHDQGAVPRLPHDHPVDHAPVRRRHGPRRRAGGHPSCSAGSTPRPGCGSSASTSASWPRGRPASSASTTSTLRPGTTPPGAIDAIRARYGADAIVPASLAGPEGIRVKRGAISSGAPPIAPRCRRPGPVER